jgi:hypothetical protein
VNFPHVYDTIAAQPGDFTVLEIPTFNWRAAAASEVFQVIHHKRILRVYTNRIAPDLADYFSLRQTPVVVRTLRILEGAEDVPLTDGELAVDRDVAPAVIRFFDIRYAIMHREWLRPDAAARIDQYLRDVMGARILAQEGTITAYEFLPPTTVGSNLALALESDRALMYLGRGWQTEPLAQVEGVSGRFVTSRTSELYFETTHCECPEPELQFRAYSEKSQDVLQFELNGRSVGAVELEQGWVNYTLPLPPESVHGGMDSLLMLHSSPQENHIAFSNFELH